MPFVIARFLLANGDTLIQRATPALVPDLRDLSASGRVWLEMTSLYKGRSKSETGGGRKV